MAIQLFQAITSAIKKAAASIAGLTNDTTPKANNGTLVDSALTWIGDNATFSANVSVSSLISNGSTTVNNNLISQRVTTNLSVNGLAYYSIQDNSSGSFVEKGWFGYGVADSGFDINNNVGAVNIRVNFVRVIIAQTDGGILMPFLKSGTTQGGAGAVAGELWHDTNNNQIKIGV